LAHNSKQAFPVSGKAAARRNFVRRFGRTAPMLVVPLTLLDPVASWELCLIAILSAFSVINIIRNLRNKR
jgi:hypothetical protein